MDQSDTGSAAWTNQTQEAQHGPIRHRKRSMDQSDTGSAGWTNQTQEAQDGPIYAAYPLGSRPSRLYLSLR
eukprot:5463851-Pyramimonas_sp.AAC.2